MAQLLKLENYISRYQENLTLYTQRFIELKRRRWEQIKHEFEWISNPLYLESLDKTHGDMSEEEIKSHHPLLHVHDSEELKAYFSKFILKAQIIWASSTLYDRSSVSPYYKSDMMLKKYLTELPDTYYLFYEPVIKLKQASVQLDPIIMTPLEIFVIKVVKSDSGSVFQGHDKHTWQEVTSDGLKKVINPLVSLNRSRDFVYKIMNVNGIDIPIKGIVIAPDSYIEFVDAPSYIELIDHRRYSSWFDQFKKRNSAIKHSQMQAAKAFLSYCETKVD